MIHSIETWDPAFFDRFSQLGQPGSLKQLERIFKSDSPFSKNNQWKAWLCEQDGKPLVRVLASFRPDAPDGYVALGYFECALPLGRSFVKSVFDEVILWVKQQGRTEIRGPIDGSIFNRSRYTLSTTRAPLFFEPDHPKEYVEILEENGFWVSTRYYGYQAPLWIGLFMARRKPPQVTIRKIDPAEWGSLLKRFYPVLMKAYANLPDFIKCTEEEFLFWQEGFSAVIDCEWSRIIEVDGEPVAFSVFVAGSPERYPISVHLGKVGTLKNAMGIFATEFMRTNVSRWFRKAEMALVASRSPLLSALPRMHRLIVRVVAEYATFSRRVDDL